MMPLVSHRIPAPPPHPPQHGPVCYILSFYVAVELYSIFAITAQEEGILGGSNWTDVWNNTDELDVLDYYEDFEVSRID